jgi:hypothetical protein
MQHKSRGLICVAGTEVSEMFDTIDKFIAMEKGIVK